ncbi:MAG: cobalt-precorrin-6A reductase [Leptolyngbya sp. SIO3F4]|nr:cobalt-precorrin-6A reductase [Leptolyngbya sp. SIO3F4]
MTIWLIGGTSESRAIAQRLTQQGLPWLVTVVSPTAARLYAGLAGPIQSGALSPAGMQSLIRQHSIRAIVDASHPFATEISQQAIATDLPYLRFERQAIPLEPPAESVPDLDTLLQPTYLENRRVLLTLGIKALHQFQPWQQRACLWARILPTAKAQAIQVGFSPEQLICDRSPTNALAEQTLWQKLGVDTVITKASGAPGGVPIKLATAKALDVRLLVIARPKLPYPQQTHDLEKVIEFCQRTLYPTMKNR